MHAQCTPTHCCSLHQIWDSLLVLPIQLKERITKGATSRGSNSGAASTTVAANGATPAVAVVRHANPANARMNQVETSEDEMSNPRTPTSVSSQGSQGYDSAGSDFVDIEGFTAIPDTSLPELNLQVDTEVMR